MAKEPIVVEGFLIDVHVPSEELLNLSVDVTILGSARYMEFVAGFQDLLNSIDLKYALRGVRGRSLRARYVRERTAYGVVRRRILRFSPYPSLFSNRLKTIRAGVYRAINRYTLVLERTQLRKLYLLPSSKAPELYAEVNRLNDELSELREDISAYEESRDYRAVLEYVKPIYDYTVNPPHARIPDIRVPARYMRLDPALYERYISESVRDRFLKEIDEEKKKALQTLQQELSRQRRELFEQSVFDLQSKITNILERLASLAEDGVRPKSLAEVKKHLKDIDEIAESVSAHHCIRELVKPSTELIEALEGGDVEKLTNAVEKIAVYAGVNPRDNPLETLHAANAVLRAKLSARAKALIDELL